MIKRVQDCQIKKIKISQAKQFLLMEIHMRKPVMCWLYPDCEWGGWKEIPGLKLPLQYPVACIQKIEATHSLQREHGEHGERFRIMIGDTEWETAVSDRKYRCISALTSLSLACSWAHHTSLVDWMNWQWSYLFSIQTGKMGALSHQILLQVAFVVIKLASKRW